MSPASSKSFLVDVSAGHNHTLIEEQLNYPRIVSIALLVAQLATLALCQPLGRHACSSIYPWGCHPTLSWQQKLMTVWMRAGQLGMLCMCNHAWATDVLILPSTNMGSTHSTVQSEVLYGTCR